MVNKYDASRKMLPYTAKEMKKDWAERPSFFCAFPAASLTVLFKVEISILTMGVLSKQAMYEPPTGLFDHK
jgi:hypothetical protein